MSTVRNSAIAGVAAVLAVGGAIWTPIRENNSLCSDPGFVGLVHEEMRIKLFEDSQVLAALTAAADVENTYVSASDKGRYADARDELLAAIEETEVVGTMKHPNNQDLKNCHLELSFSNVFTDSDLISAGVPNIIGGPDFQIIARFEIKLQNLAGVQLQENVAAERNQILVGRIEGGEVVDAQIARGKIVDSEVRGGTLIEGDIEAGTLVEAARVATLTRRDFTIKEPEFVDIDYSTSFGAETAIEGGFFGKPVDRFEDVVAGN